MDETTQRGIIAIAIMLAGTVALFYIAKSKPVQLFVEGSKKK